VGQPEPAAGRIARPPKRLTITDAASIALGLQDEIRRSEESRYDHRLHGVLLVAQGMSCSEVAGLLGDAPRSVENWVRRFEKSGLAGLREGEHPGRPQRLNPEQVTKINRILRQTPRDAGLSQNLWDGKSLSAWIEREYGIRIDRRRNKQHDERNQWQRTHTEPGPTVTWHCRCTQGPEELLGFRRQCRG
jgi:transposase